MLCDAVHKLTTALDTSWQVEQDYGGCLARDHTYRNCILGPGEHTKEKQIIYYICLYVLIVNYFIFVQGGGGEWAGWVQHPLHL
jgi:hypothetical protein